jgi:O-antigen/teichoic acid export membrane protein
MTQHAAPSGRRITGDVVVQLAGRVFNLALGVIVTLALIRKLGDDGFGQWATLLAVTQIAGMFGELGLEEVTTARAAEDRRREREWIGALATTRLLLAIPIAAVAAVVVLAVSNSTDMTTAGLILCVGLLFGSVSALRIVFRLRVRNDVPTVIMTVNSVLWTAAVVTLLTGDPDLVVVAALLTVISVGLNFVQAGLAVRVLGSWPKFFNRHWRELLHAGTWAGVASLLAVAYVKIDQIFVFELAGDRDAGLYGAVYRILDQAQAIPVIAMTTLMPIMAATFVPDPERAWRVFVRTIGYLGVASLPLLGFTIVAAEPTVTTLFGDDFSDAAPALPVLMAAFVLTALSYAVDGVILIQRKQRRLARNAGIALVVNVVLNVALVPTYGFMAAAWATLVTQAIVLALNAVIVVRRVDAGPIASILARAAYASAVMAWVLVGLRIAGAPFGVLVVVAPLVYVPAALALGAPHLDELKALLRREGEFARAVEA